MTTPSLEWTVMIYFAADNDLTPFAYTNLDQIQKIGSTDQVHILAQLDTFVPDAKANRFFISVGGGLKQFDIDEPNSGSVADFVDFIKWGINEGHRAKRYLIVLWGHGRGVDDFPGDESSPPDEIRVAVEEVASPPFAGNLGVPAALGVGLETLALGPKSAVPTVDKTIPENTSLTPIAAILPDGNPRDALTSRELKEALDQARKELGVEKIDIVGMDACLMSMVEIARQISDAAGLMVSSEQTIPNNSWPYGNIIRKLVYKSPPFEPPDLARTIVDEYVAFYEASPSHEQVVLSACDLAKTDPLTYAIGQLVTALRKSLSTKELRLALVKARQSTLSFFISDFVDLYHFCSVLQNTLDSDPFKTACQTKATLCEEVRAACKGVMQVIHPDDGCGFVIRSAGTSSATALANANGVSIYFPLILPLYGELEFSKTTNWDGFLKDYMKVFFGADVSDSTANLTSRSTSPIDSNGSNSKGGITVMKGTPASAPNRTPCIVLPKGTSIKDKKKGFAKKLTGLAFLEMVQNPEVTVPGGTKLDIPGEGKKASSGTETKTAPAGTRIGTPAAPVLEMVLPACTLRETAPGNPTTELSDGTTIKTKGASSPIIALAQITIAPPKPVHP